MQRQYYSSLSSLNPLGIFSFSLVLALLGISAAALSVEPVVEWLGTWQQGGLLLGQVEPGATVIYQGEIIKTTAEGQFLVGFGRNAPARSTFVITDTEGVAAEAEYDIVPRSYPIQKVEGVPQRTVQPPAGQLQRIRSDSALVVEARRLVTDKTDFLAGFIKPLEGPITGVYGSQRFYNGVPKSPHYGLDYAAPKGTIVKAPAAGIVRLAHDDLFYSGGTLIIDHGHGLSSSFLHLSEILVLAGRRVERGDAIARVGSTGRATGPHLDWRMNWLNQRVDPALVLESFPAQ
jgi:murein DD-endopeptidase MepM/ murein hydrolase activator NlpD|tara:strand:+ start:6946 stop:7815 length:870 start_codon:yes stop_codon:yes gene_type:complete